MKKSTIEASKISNIRQCHIAEYNTLSEGAREDYDTVCRYLISQERILSCDLPLLLSYARCREEIRIADKAIQENGVLLSEYDRNGHPTKKSNPAIRIKNDALNELRQISLLFGLSPLGRKRIDARDEITEQTIALNSFFKDLN